MRIPKSFKHKGKTWKVEHQIDLTEKESCSGMADFDSRTIYLASELKGKKKKEVFLHELFHVVIFEAHINPGTRFGGGLEEVLCDAFADLVCTSFTNLKWKKPKK